MNYLYGAVAGLILLLGGMLAWRNHQYEKSQAQIGQLVFDMGQAVNANAAQKKVIETLSRANAMFANSARLQQSEYRDLLADHVRLRVKWQAAEAARVLRERHDRTSAACRAVLDLDLSTACPNIEASIRERAK